MGEDAATGTMLQYGLFDIFQVDPILNESPSEMYSRRLDNLAVADQLGLAAAFTAERHFLQNYACPSATAWIAAASQRVTGMRLGMLGYTLPLRAPVQLAEDVVVLDHLAQGRLEVGLGLGHRTEELTVLGVDPADRIAIFKERLALLRRLWTGAEVNYQRGDVKVNRAAIAPLPAQQPHPPMWFAGTDPVAAHWMGAMGLGLAVGFKPTEQLKPAVASFRDGRKDRTPDVRAAEPKRPLGDVALMRAVYLAETDEMAMEEITDDLLRLTEVFEPTATEANRPDRREQARTRAEAMLQDDVMFAGSPETVAAAIEQTRVALDLDLLLANPYAAGVDHDRVRRTLRLLAGPVREQQAMAQHAALV